MKHYLFCAGGCGARVLEALVHLCAPGLGPKEIKVLIIDSDAGGGNLELTNQIINSYNACQSFYGGNLGEEQFFRTELSLLADNGGGAAGAWSPVHAGQQFKDVLGYGNLGDTQKQVADLLFTSAEREMHMNVGFLGHPSIGAGALSLLPLLETGPPWSNISGQMSVDCAAGQVRVVIAGSVFGGTGASTFFPLSLWLRRAAGANAHNLKIGVVALSPYFMFPPAPAGPAPVEAGHNPGPAANGPGQGPDARKFPLATRAAAQFYDQMRVLGHWPFSAMFWLGDDEPINLHRFEGGPNQQNPPHFLELLAAQAALDFYDAVPQSGLCYYAGTAGGGPNVITWADIPRLQQNMTGHFRSQILKFLLCGLMHTDFYWPLFHGRPGAAPILPEAISWYDKYFVRRGKNLNDPPRSDAMQALDDFGRRHIVWWEALHHTTPGRVQLLNSTAIVSGPDAAGADRVRLDKKRMGNLDYPDNAVKHGDGETEFHNFTFAGFPSGASDGVPAYLAILARAATRFVKRHYGV